MSDDGEHRTIYFLKTVFGPSTEENVYVCSLPNQKGGDGPVERSISDRDADNIITFINRWDEHGRAVYGCISTVKAGMRRQKPNCVETPALPTDIDFKSILDTPAEVDRALSTCRLLPSIIVSSGNGRHPYWILKEALRTQENLERIEAVLKQLADTFAGDLQPAHVAALMRLPGTHNTKGGQWIDVLCTDDNGLRYELDELEEWLAEQSPLLRRKVRPAPPPNPYIATGDLAFGFKPSIDVERRLAAMIYQGEGEAAIHATQVAVTSSLVSRGVEIEQIVALVCDATRHAAGDYGARWNWRREEANIRRMCVTWANKIAERDARKTHAGGAAHTAGSARSNERKKTGPDPYANAGVRPDDDPDVVDLNAARAKRAKPGPAAPEPKSKKFVPIAKRALEAMDEAGEAIEFHGELTWHYTDQIWRLLFDNKPLLNMRLEVAAAELDVASDSRLINEARAWILRQPQYNVMYNVTIPWDQHRQVPVRGGLIDPTALAFTPAAAEHRVTWRVEAPYVPGAQCPLWLQMLSDTFANQAPAVREQTIGMLQEVLGAGLIDSKPRGMRKALVLVGGALSGKSELLKVFSALFGSTVISTSMEAVNETHGLSEFIHRLPWVLDETFNGQAWHASDLVKALITGDRVSINVKFKTPVAKRYTGPIFWASNHEPQFKESTRAIVDRLLVIKCLARFDKEHPAGVALLAQEQGLSDPSELVIRDELPGVLAWALEGLQRALARRYIGLNDEAREALEELYDTANMVVPFIKECCEYDPDGMVSMPDFVLAFSSWWLATRAGDTRRNPPSSVAIGKQLSKMDDPCIAGSVQGHDARYVIGLRLSQTGLDYHRAAPNIRALEGIMVGTTMEAGGGKTVNKPIPETWESNPKTAKVVVFMRRAHRLRTPKKRDDGVKTAPVAHPDLSRGVTGLSVGETLLSENLSSSQPIDVSKKPLF